MTLLRLWMARYRYGLKIAHNSQFHKNVSFKVRMKIMTQVIIIVFWIKHCVVGINEYKLSNLFTHKCSNVKLGSQSTYKLMFTFLRNDDAIIDTCGNYTGTVSGFFGTGTVRTGALPTLVEILEVFRDRSLEKLKINKISFWQLHFSTIIECSRRPKSWTTKQLGTWLTKIERNQFFNQDIGYNQVLKTLSKQFRAKLSRCSAGAFLAKLMQSLN